RENAYIYYVGFAVEHIIFCFAWLGKTRSWAKHSQPDDRPQKCGLAAYLFFFFRMDIFPYYIYISELLALSGRIRAYFSPRTFFDSGNMQLTISASANEL